MEDLTYCGRFGTCRPEMPRKVGPRKVWKETIEFGEPSNPLGVERMPIDVASQLAAAKRAEYHVVSELLKRGGIPYLPVVDTGTDTLVKTAQGFLLELTVLLPVERVGTATRTFTIPDYKPDKKRFILCVEFDDTDSPVAWVFPSMVFHAYSTCPNKRGLKSLNLKEGRKDLLPYVLDKYLIGFRNRWEIIADYKHYRRFMNSPEGYDDLEDILSMLIASERKRAEDESIPFQPIPPESADVTFR